ncbi:MAG: Na+ dependent nucleoside transporter N-terminal domain-containing protein, partial [Myxococcota bacterium]
MLAKLARVVATGIVLVAVAFCLGCSDPSGGAPVGLLDQDIPVDWFGRARSLLGLFLMLGVAYVMSNRRSSVDFRLVITGVALQIVLGLVTLSPPGRLVFGGVNQGVRQLLAYTGEGASFLFGDLALQNALPVGRSKLPLPEDPARTDEWLARAKNGPIETPAEAGNWSFVNVGAFVGFGVLHTIIFYSSLMAVM